MRKQHIIFLISFLIISVVIYFFRDSYVINSVTSFFQGAFSNTRAALFDSRVGDEEKLIAENRNLSEKLSQIETIERENNALKSQFDENQKTGFELVPARIVGYRGRGAYESFMVDAGKTEGIRDGMAVILGTTLVGTIHKASQNISEVRTILHPEFSTIVKYPKSGARGIIRGFNSFIILENVLITDSLDKGGIVSTMGEVNSEGIGIPADIIVGRIDSIEKEETASFQSAQVAPLVDYSQISNVFVVLGL